MNSLNRAVDRFCYRHPRFGIRNLMTFIIAGNAFVYVVAIMDRSGAFLRLLAFSPRLILHGEVWRLVTFAFIPMSTSVSDILWVGISLYFYYFIGGGLERQWGAGRFTIFYASGMIINVIFGYVFYLCGYRVTYYGMTAYYVNLSMFFAFAALYPDAQVLFMFIIPMKIKWLAYIDAAYFALEIVTNSSMFPMNLLPAVAFLNVLLFCGSYIFSGLPRMRPRPSPSVVNYRKAEKADEHKPYHHKCAVCGRTDADHPELEFRYCSRCAGYHCFCQDHINNHVHFKE